MNSRSINIKFFILSSLQGKRDVEFPCGNKLLTALNANHVENNASKSPTSFPVSKSSFSRVAQDPITVDSPLATRSIC